MDIMEESQKRALEMQLAPDNKFDFKQAAQAIGGVNIPTTYAFGLSPENVTSQTQLGQQALKTKQTAVQETIESAMQRDSQLTQKLQLAHSTVMSEKKHSLDKELAQVEKARAAASIRASDASVRSSDAQVGLTNSQTEMAGLKLQKMQKELSAINVAEKLSIPVPLIGKDGKTEIQDIPLLAAQAAGFNVSGIVSSQIRANSAAAAKVKPWLAHGMDETDGYILGESYADVYKANLNSATKMATQKSGGLRNKDKAKTPEQIQQEALAGTIEFFKTRLSPEGYEALKSLNILPETTEAAPAQAGGLTPEDMELLKNTILESTR